MTDQPISLPVIMPPPAGEEKSSQPIWEGFSLPEGMVLPSASDSPEPELPQGEYSNPGSLQTTPTEAVQSNNKTPVELLAPAGGAESAFAAFQYGADAVYLGLKKFSARAEAENFTLDELAELVDYAHGLTPRRRVFVTMNTLIKQEELAELVETLVRLGEIGVDALIIQDLGVYEIVRKWFPDLEMHASTQLAVHNRAGAQAIKNLGFKRLVLARELTLEEVDEITKSEQIETEVFVHGALCYSYSGLCLFSSQTLGRSGNRGKCAYSCRDSYQVSNAPSTLRDGTGVRRDPAEGFPFSMKDLALPDFLPRLRLSGVSCFKIEGRKKSPLYVATTTSYYRGIIDGKILSEEDRARQEADMQAVFSRPWTRLFVQSHRDKEVADRDTVGHRGTPIGRVESLRIIAEGDHRIRFRTDRALECHDGLQIDLPTLGKPFGFPVHLLWIVDRYSGKTRKTFEAPAGAFVEVGLPVKYPEIPLQATVYCSSSQDVKRRFRHDRPKAGLHRVRWPIDILVTVQPDGLSLEAEVPARKVKVQLEVPGTFTTAREVTAMEGATRLAFDKLGDTNFSLGRWTFNNPDGLFVPISRLNQARRDLTSKLEESLVSTRQQATAMLQKEICPPRKQTIPSASFSWSIKVDRIAMVSAFESMDWDNLDELTIDITRDHPSLLVDQLNSLAEKIGRDKIRLGLPALTRKWEEKGIIQKITRLRAAGWHRWEVANLSGWTFLEPMQGIDLSTDWSVYVVNRQAAQHLLNRGVTRFTLSPEDGLPNIRSLLAEFADQAVVIVHQDTPMFLSESCAYANLIGGCPGKANCRFESMEMVSSHGEKVTAIDYHCRTIVLNQGPFCLSPRLGQLAANGARRLRADFIYRDYSPEVVQERWRRLKAGKAIEGGHSAHFDQGMI